LMAYPIQVKNDIDDISPILPETIIIYFCVWYLFTITTNGVWVPSGLFLPGILLGCSVGIMYMQTM